jgi:hypothetical protein
MGRRSPFAGGRNTRRVVLAAAGVCLLCGPGWPGPAVSQTSIAVIAHPGLPVEDLSLSELRRVFLGERQFWAEDLPVTLLVPPPGTPERAALLDKVYRRTETQYRHYWIAKVFRAEAVSAPKVVPSDTAVAELVREIEGSIAVVATAQVPSGVKVLRVNGKAWKDNRYPLE